MGLLALLAIVAFALNTDDDGDGGPINAPLIDPWADDDAAAAQAAASAASATDDVVAAQQLARLLAVSPNVRAGKQRSDAVAALQARMGQLEPDGFVGPLTIARARALGVSL